MSVEVIKPLHADAAYVSLEITLASKTLVALYKVGHGFHEFSKHKSSGRSFMEQLKNYRLWLPLAFL